MHRGGVILILALAACGDGSSTLSGSRVSSHSSSSGGNSGTNASSSSGAVGDDDDTAPTNPDPVVSDGSPAQTCVDTINAYRKTKGLPALERWTAQESCADSQASKDGASGGAHGAFGKCQESSQNECPGWPGPAGTMIPQCLDAMWSQGPGEGHYDNMASKTWKRVACGFANGQGGVWSVQNFQ